ncbi:hypothetical protein, partial [Prevotella multiformis]|uniref:hypothetical protein n=1 Tax=Prevotella multiformis TaxID=282402 RepID=UPI0028DB3D21
FPVSFNSFNSFFVHLLEPHPVLSPNSAVYNHVRNPSGRETKSSKHLDASEFSPILVLQT